MKTPFVCVRAGNSETETEPHRHNHIDSRLGHLGPACCAGLIKRVSTITTSMSLSGQKSGYRLEVSASSIFHPSAAGCEKAPRPVVRWLRPQRFTQWVHLVGISSPHNHTCINGGALGERQLRVVSVAKRVRKAPTAR